MPAISKTSQHIPHLSARTPARHLAGAKSKPTCKFCQRSRWLMTFTVLLVLASVALLNLGQ